MKKNFKFTALAFAACISLLPSALASEVNEGYCQGWTEQRNGQRSCQVSIYTLLASPAVLDGQRVATFGYILYEGHPSSMMGPSPDALRRIDFIGCIAVNPEDIEGQNSLASMKHGIYFVMAEGLYSKGSQNGACVGRIVESHISRIVSIKEPY